jgi:WD40 repeat protein
MKPIFILIVTSALLTGCVTHKKSYTIRDLNSGEKVTLMRQSWYPEEIVDLDDQTKTFRIFTRSKEGGFEIWDVSYNGTIMRKIKGEKDFSDRIIRWYWLYREAFEVSANGSQLAYFDEPSRELRLFNIKDGSERVLLANVATNNVHITMLNWYSKNELIVGANRWGGGAKARLLMFNTDNKSIIFEQQACWLIESAHLTLSHNKRYLIYGDEYDMCPKGCYKIYDIQMGKEIGIIIGRGSIYGNAYWSDGDETIVYADGDDLMEYSISSKSFRCLKSFPAKDTIHILGYESGRIFYGLGMGADIAPLRIYNVATGAERIIKNISLNGRMIISPGGEYIITGWGF